MNFSNILRDLLFNYDITQTELARRIDVKPSQISEWLKGKANPGYDTLKNIAIKLDISPSYLLGLDELSDFKLPTTTPLSSESYSVEERSIIASYRKLPEALKKLVRDQLEVYGETEELLSKNNKKV